MGAIDLPLDHVVLLTADLEKAAALFSALGFTVTPRTEHSREMGTANRCVMLRSTYIELLTIVRDTERSASWRALLDRGAGLRGLALRTGDAAASCEALHEAGFDSGQVIDFSRADEAGDLLRFRVCRLPASDTDGFRLIVCEHQTPELLWRPEWTAHANGGGDIIGVEMGAGNSIESSTTLRAVAAALRKVESGDWRSTPVSVVAPEGTARLTLSVGDLTAARRHLGRNAEEVQIDCRPALDLTLVLQFAP